MTDRYLHYQYKSGARGEDGYIDCWGLTRLARHELYGLPMLPSFAEARYSRKGSVQAAYVEQASRMQRITDRKPGAVVAVMRMGICIHVAVMTDNAVLEIKREGQKARLTPWREFARQYPAPMWDVQFYD